MSYRTDLRVERSKKLIKQAFLDLLEEQNFEEITIKDIASRAMVSRKTFYVYYATKMELYEEIVQEYLQKLIPDRSQWNRKRQREDPEGVLREKLIFVLQQLNQERKVYRILIYDTGSHLFQTRLKRFIQEEVLAEIQQAELLRLPKDYPVKLYEMQSYAIIYSFLSWWVAQYSVNVEEMADIILEVLGSSGLIRLHLSKKEKV
ncbi:MAG: TetR/AcrR family transcriptional regulator [Eubacteriales bacterium]